MFSYLALFRRTLFARQYGRRCASDVTPALDFSVFGVGRGAAARISYNTDIVDLVSAAVGWGGFADRAVMSLLYRVIAAATKGTRKYIFCFFVAPSPLGMGFALKVGHYLSASAQGPPLLKERFECVTCTDVMSTVIMVASLLSA